MKSKTVISTKPLDTLTLPFGGSRLIEASAGTGKTFTIAGLYIRLLLGDGISTPLTCDQILVVTFTNAATGELRDRIRSKIQLAYRHFIGLDSKDELITSLYQKIAVADRPHALKRLDLALKSLDEAAIYTIHGFCQRILTDMAFESSLLFESRFTLDDSEFLHHAVRDFWREHCYSLPLVLAEPINRKFSSPDALTKALLPLLGASQAQVITKPVPFDKLQQRLIDSLNRLKLIWPKEYEATETLLRSLPLNGQRFGKKADDYPKLAALFNMMESWCEFGDSLPPAKVLEQLSLSELKLNKGGVLPTPEQAPLLAHIEQLSLAIKNFIPSFLLCAKVEIKKRYEQQKLAQNILTPDDLLLTLSRALTPLEETETATPSRNAATTAMQTSSTVQPHIALAKQIAARFPIALIDEFQDTDPLQYTIFSQIYQQQYDGTIKSSDFKSNSVSLLMIGDPKQAIYAFRGADIHTYIAAREQTQEHYNLDTNYRSSHNMILAINALFNSCDNPFISDAIPFETVNPSPYATDKRFIDSHTEPKNDSSALKLKLLSEDPEKGLNKATAQTQLAEDAASEIERLLNEAQSGQCTIDGKPLKAKDIAILVRNRHEADIIKRSLSSRQIGAIFLSRDSVFNTTEAREVAIIIIALANPKDEQAIRAALATSLLGFSAESIHQFNQDENNRQHLLELFHNLHQLWLKRGVMPALLNLADETGLIQRLLQCQDGYRRLTDFRHLGELLQQKATELDGHSALVHWYQQTLVNTNATDEAQLRLESEQNLVQIVTIHKSKGLEYPVCFIPFISLARESSSKPSPLLYHKEGELIWDIEQSNEGWEQQKQEILAEDLRLLYVALTRPVYQCYLYIANYSKVTKRSGLSSHLYRTAIGYLLGIESKDCQFDVIQAATQKLSSDEIRVTVVDSETFRTDKSTLGKESANINAISTSVQSLESQPQLSPKILKRRYITPWRIGSYSSLVRNAIGHQSNERSNPGSDDELFPELTIIKDEPLIMSRFNFERGANAGSFMHLVLEMIDFTQAESDLELQLPKAMERYGIDETWYPILKSWYLDLLHAPLSFTAQFNKTQPITIQSDKTQPSATPLTLAQITPSQRLVEMEFYLPIEQLEALKLTQLLTEYGYRDEFSGELNFDTLKGMLKGFIDLVFEDSGQFFIADYKSNHLGDDFSDYTESSIEHAIRSHYYHLQYILYSLALHRYLKLRVATYDYDKDFGGCFYLFLRGMSTAQPSSGVYFDKPPKGLIESLDQLISEPPYSHKQTKEEAIK